MKGWETERKTETTTWEKEGKLRKEECYLQKPLSKSCPRPTPQGTALVWVPLPPLCTLRPKRNACYQTDCLIIHLMGNNTTVLLLQSSGIIDDCSWGCIGSEKFPDGCCSPNLLPRSVCWQHGEGNQRVGEEEHSIQAKTKFNRELGEDTKSYVL